MATKDFDNIKFKRLRQLLNLNQTQFAEKVNSSQQIIAMIENNKRGIPSSIREAFYNTYNISIEEATQATSSEELVNMLNSKLIKDCTDKDNYIVDIPLYNIGAAAGAGTWLGDEPCCEKLYFDSRWLQNILRVNPKNLHGIFASGDSMDSGFQNVNSIKDGDLLLVDSSNTTGNNGIFIIRVNNAELRVKRLVKKLDGSLIIISDNPKYPEEVYRPDESDYTVEVIGKVVWNGSKENI